MEDHARRDAAGQRWRARGMAHGGPPAGSEAMSEIAFFDDGASDITIEVDVPIRFY